MAALGAIGGLIQATTYRKVLRTWTAISGGVRMFGNTLAADSRRYNNELGRATISGIVYENSVPKERLVRVYRRDTGELLSSVTSSAADGSYSLPIAYTGHVFLVAFDAAGAPLLNAVVLDYMVAL